jgi:hypothetical protein
MENKTVQELKNYCRDNNISGFSKYTKKQELLQFVNNKLNDKKNLQMNQPKQVDQDAELAKLLYESEKVYYIQKQNESIQKQKEEFMKQQAEQDEINRLHNLKKIEEDALMKLEQEQEYEKALQEDLKKMEMMKCKEERDIKYAAKISNEDMNIIRMARLARFN